MAPDLYQQPLSWGMSADTPAHLFIFTNGNTLNPSQGVRLVQPLSNVSSSDTWVSSEVNQETLTLLGGNSLTYLRFQLHWLLAASLQGQQGHPAQMQASPARNQLTTAQTIAEPQPPRITT